MLDIIDASNSKAIGRVLARDRASDRAFERSVAAIVDRVREEGDRALVGFARRFDGVTPPLEISTNEMRAGASHVPADVRQAIKQAAQNIARVAKRQVPKGWKVAVTSGVSVNSA